MVANFGVASPCWKPPRFQMQLTSTGGLLGKKSEPVECDVHPVTKCTFVKVTKSQRWLQRLVAGIVNNQSLSSTTLLETITEKMMTASDHGDGQDCPPDADDPMIDLEYDGHGHGFPDDNPSSAPPPLSTKRIQKNAIVEVNMPLVCPTASAHGNGQERRIKLWYRGNKRCIWLAQEDLEWAASYLGVELDTCGVPPVSDDTNDTMSSSTDSPSPESPGPRTGPRMRWDFSRDVWSFTPRGKQTLHFVGLDDLELADTSSCSSLSEGDFERLSYVEKKAFAYEKARRLTLGDA